MITTNLFEERSDVDGKDYASAPVIFHKGKNLRLLTMDRVILQLSARLALAGAVRVTSCTVDERVYLLLDWEEIEKAFADFVGYGREIVVRGAGVKILGKVLPVAAGGGCALISISFPGNRRPMLVRHREGSGPLSALQGIVERHRGALRISEEQRRMLLSIYLPVFRGDNGRRSQDDDEKHWNKAD